MIKTTTFICQLPQATQNAIKADVENYLKSEGFSGQKLQEALQNALDGRLTDLEENIDISKYL